MTDNNLFSATLSSTCLDGFCFKFNRLIKHDYLLHALLLFILQVQYGFFLLHLFCLKNKHKNRYFGMEQIIYFHINFNVKNCFVIQVNRNTSSAWQQIKLVLRGSTVIVLVFIICH